MFRRFLNKKSRVVEDTPQNALASVSRPHLITKGVQEPATPYSAPNLKSRPLPTVYPNDGGSGGNTEAGGMGGGLKKGGKVSGSGKSSSVSSASKRGDGIAKKGKTKGRMI